VWYFVAKVLLMDEGKSKDSVLFKASNRECKTVT